MKLEKLKAGTRNTKTIKFPGTDNEVVLRVLSNAERQDAVFAAEEHFKSRKIEIAATCLDAYEDERTTQLLFRALRDCDNSENTFASSADSLRENLTREEKEFLTSEYTTFEQECSPAIEKMSDEDFEKLWEELKKNPEPVLSFLNSGTLRRLIIFLASRQQNSQTASCSTS